MLLYQDPVFQEHQTGNHPEHPRRLEMVSKHLRWLGLDSICTLPPWKPISSQRLSLVHSLGHAERIKNFAEHGGGWIDDDTFACSRSYEVALMAAGAVCDATERVVAGEDSRAFCLIRPPGHHALPNAVMGFCLFNNVALAARVATAELGLDRVLIVDWDVHHGNGTQATFWEDERVGFFSIHRHPFYPGTGTDDETGSGRGLGTTRNLPIKWGTTRKEYLMRFEQELSAFAERLRPQLVFLSAGFDAHREDPIGSLGLETEDFGKLTQIITRVAAEHAGGGLVSVLEGGYNPNALTDCVDIHLNELIS
jgi:acetoin utilization deacetylase AcuC-like enzyme